MDIMIIGVPGSGKSEVGDIIKNTIFKIDPNSTIINHDPDRTYKPFGDGKNIYNIYTKQVDSLPLEEMKKYGVVITLNGTAVKEWIKEVL